MPQRERGGFKFENNGKSRMGKRQKRRDERNSVLANNIGRATFLASILPDDEQEKLRKQKRL